MKKKTRFGFLGGALVVACALGADQPGINNLPDMKEGLWESNTMMTGAMDKPMRTTMCTSNAVTRKMYEDLHKNADRPCKEIRQERHGSVITQETECNFNGKLSRSTSITTLSGNTGMRIETHKADGSVETVIDTKWIGACPTGMKLGDVTGPDGKVMMNAMSP